MNPIIALSAAFALGGPTIFISGAVSKPGEYNVTEPIKLRTLIRTARVRDDADRTKIEITSSNGAVRIVDGTELDQNFMLSAGDTVRVPIADPASHVFVSGAVQSRGALKFRSGMTLGEALRQAGTPNGVGLDRVRVTRAGPNGKETVLIADMSVPQTRLQANIALLPGDRIAVPHMRDASMSDRELLTIVVIGLLILVIVSN